MRLRRAPAALMIVVFALFAAGIGLGWITHDPQTAGGWGGGGTAALAGAAVALSTFAVVGALIASQQPRNAIGWLLIAVGFSWALDSTLEGYARYGLTTNPGSLPLAAYADSLDNWLWVCSVGIMGTFLFQLFPDGHALSPRWRLLTWASAVSMATAAAATGLASGRLSDSVVSTQQNPLGISALPWLSGAASAALTVMLLTIPVSAASLVVRYRRSNGIARLQLKWLAAAVSAVVAFYAVVITISTGDHPPLWLEVLQDMTVMSFCLIPIAIGAAVLRYHLYDIDLIVRRTVIYATLVAALAVLYVAAITGLGWVGRELTGQSGATAVTLSTLLVAVSFQPLRTRIQSAVDSRFYRRRYDSAAAVAHFASSLRSEIDLDEINGELAAVVHQTVRPSHVSVWLRTGGVTPR